MSEENPLEFITNQLERLMELIKQIEQRPLDFPPNINLMIDKLRKDISQFKEMNKKMTGSAGISQEDLDRALRNKETSKLTLEQKKVAERLNKIKTEAENLHYRVAIALQSAKKKEAGASEEKKDLTPKQKMKGFGRKTWKKM